MFTKLRTRVALWIAPNLDLQILQMEAQATSALAQISSLHYQLEQANAHVTKAYGDRQDAIDAAYKRGERDAIAGPSVAASGVIRAIARHMRGRVRVSGVRHDGGDYVSISAKHDGHTITMSIVARGKWDGTSLVVTARAEERRTGSEEMSWIGRDAALAGCLEWADRKWAEAVEAADAEGSISS